MFKPSLVKLTQDDTVYFTDEKLSGHGFSLFFSTRRTGFSQSPYSSLNLGLHVGDDLNSVKSNWQKTAKLFKFNLTFTFLVKQVHGDKIQTVTKTLPSWPHLLADADSLTADQSGITLAILTADCVPVILVDLKHKRVAAIHAGWRGTLAGITTKALQEMCKQGSRLEDIYAYIGPAIGSCCYQVDKERWQLFQSKFTFIRSTDRKLDLPAINAQLLREQGLFGNHICILDACTSCQPELFYSYRREKVTGRQAAIISIN